MDDSSGPAPSLAPPDRAKREATGNGLHFSVLEPVRGLAALWVVLFHFEFSEPFRTSFPLAHSLFKMGDRAVPLFFVVSGLCITISAVKTHRQSRSPISFLTRRACRIFPTFWYSIVAILSIRLAAFATKQLTPVLGTAHPLNWPDYTWEEWFRCATMLSIFESEGFWWERFSAINGAYWTLAIEFQCYVLVFLALCTGRRFGAVLLLTSVASLVVYLHTPLFSFFAWRGLFLAFWAWFACGIILWLTVDRGWLPDRVCGRYRRIVCVTILVVLAAIVCGCALAGIELERLAVALGTAVALWAMLEFDADFARLAGSRFRAARVLFNALKNLGAMSYSLYLLHNVLLESFESVLGRVLSSHGTVANVLTVTFAVLCAWPFYLLCERPFANPNQGHATPHGWFVRHLRRTVLGLGFKREPAVLPNGSLASGGAALSSRES